jgi:hypothetical protein
LERNFKVPVTYFDIVNLSALFFGNILAKIGKLQQFFYDSIVACVFGKVERGVACDITYLFR